jgi:uncharacterized metal-binding protein
MASGKNHDRITLIGLPLVAAASLAITKSTDLTFWIASSFLFSGLMFGPDLDIYSRQYQRWGWLRWLWRPYQRCIRHRSILSHGPIIGTIVRILYLCLWLGLIGFIYLMVRRSIGYDLEIYRQWLNLMPALIINHQQQILATVIGLELGAMSHYLADIISSTTKQWHKRSTARLIGRRSKKKKV